MMEYFPSELEVFSIKPINLTFVENEVIAYGPQIFSATPNQPLEFQSLGFANKVKDISNLQLNIKFRITKKNGENYTTADTKQPSLINNYINAMIKSCQITIQSTVVQNIEQSYGILRYIEDFLTFDNLTTENQMSIQGLYPLDSFKTDIAARVKDSQLVDGMVKINPFHTTRYLLTSASLSVRLTFQDSSFYIVEAETKAAVPPASGSDGSPAEYTSSAIYIEEVKLIIPHKTMTDSHVERFNSFLKSQPANYLFKKPFIVSNVIQPNVLSAHSPNLYTGQRPRMVVCCFLTNQDYSGNSQSQTFNFNHFNINSLALLVNDQFFPSQPYTFDFENNSYSRIFHSTLEALRIRDENDSNLLKYSNYKNNFFVAFDLTGSGDSALSELNVPFENASIGVALTFSKANTEPINCILYMLCDTHVTIDALRNVDVIY